MRVTKAILVLSIYLTLTIIGGLIGIVSTPDYSYAELTGGDPPITDTIPADSTGYSSSYIIDDKTQGITQVDNLTLFWNMLSVMVTTSI